MKSIKKLMILLLILGLLATSACSRSNPPAPDDTSVPESATDGSGGDTEPDETDPVTQPQTTKKPGATDAKTNPPASTTKPPASTTKPPDTASNELKIQQQPKSAAQTKMNRVTFAVAATGEGLSYQWEIKSGNSWVKITPELWIASGEKSASLSIAHNENAKLRCVVTDKNGKSVTSSEVNLTVNLLGSAFMMYIEDAFTAAGQKVVTANILNGSVKKGDSVYLVRAESGEVKAYKVLKMEASRKEVDSAKAGDNIGMILENPPDDIKRGDLLTSDQGMFAFSGNGKKTFKATFFFKALDGSASPRNADIPSGFEPYVYAIKDYEVIFLFEGNNIKNGGTQREVTVTTKSLQQLRLPVYPGQTVAVRDADGGKTIGYMVIETVGW